MRCACAALVALVLTVCSARAQSGVEIDAGYTLDAFSLARGGVDPGGALIHHAEAGALFDGERLVGVVGLTASFRLLASAGTALSERRVGDVQVVSSIEAPRAVRLFEAWAEQRLSEGRVGLLVGVRDLNAEFAASDAAGLFVGAAHGIGTELAQTGLNGPSIFPITALSVRADYVSPSGAFARVAAFDGVAGDPDRPARTSLLLDRDDGALLIAEVGATHEGAWRKVALGAWGYTEQFDQIDGPSQAPSYGAYVIAEREWTDRVTAYARLGWANPEVHQTGVAWAAGIVSGGLASRPDDEMGLGVAAAHNTSRYLRVLRQDAAADRAEYVVELTYRAILSSRISVQPDVQYIVQPGTDPSLDDALLIGVRVSASW